MSDPKPIGEADRSCLVTSWGDVVERNGEAYLVARGGQVGFSYDHGLGQGTITSEGARFIGRASEGWRVAYRHGRPMDLHSRDEVEVYLRRGQAAKPNGRRVGSYAWGEAGAATIIAFRVTRLADGTIPAYIAAPPSNEPANEARREAVATLEADLAPMLQPTIAASDIREGDIIEFTHIVRVDKVEGDRISTTFPHAMDEAPMVTRVSSLEGARAVIRLLERAPPPFAAGDAATLQSGCAVEVLKVQGDSVIVCWTDRDGGLRGGSYSLSDLRRSS